jgi:hypothetical protein
MRLLMMAFLAAAQAAPRPTEPGDFLKKAVLEGLKEDGADPAFVKDNIAGKPELFVIKCPICEPVKSAFIHYGSAPKPAGGKGLPKDIVDDLKNPTRLVQLKALERLVDRYVASHKDRLKLTDAQRQELQAKLEQGKKTGMEMVELGKQKGFDFCPSCSGATKAK